MKVLFSAKQEALDAKNKVEQYGLRSRVKGTDYESISDFLNTVDFSTSEKPAEHKSHNIIELENGQFCLYPNNRMRVYDNSLTPDQPLQPDFKVSTEIYQVENGQKFRLGDTDEYFWKAKDE